MYFSVLFDESSNAKTNNKKELLIKTCEKGKPNFNVMSLEEVKDSCAPGLKATLEESIGKM